jgi:RNA polymerase sigma factor (sigma-70 family)
VHVHPLIHAELSRQRGLELRANPSPRYVGQADRSLLPVVRAAAGGDSQAWETLVGTFGPIVRRVVQGYRLGAADVEDVVQATWESAFTHIDRLRDPDALGGWLCVIARREALRVLDRQRRETVVEVESLADESAEPAPDAALVEQERARAVRAAIERLPERQQALVAGMLHESGRSYSEVARLLGVPIGSIGPTRERALARLRRDRELRSWSRSPERAVS